MQAIAKYRQRCFSSKSYRRTLPISLFAKLEFYSTLADLNKEAETTSQQLGWKLENEPSRKHATLSFRNKRKFFCAQLEHLGAYKKGEAKKCVKVQSLSKLLKINRMAQGGPFSNFPYILSASHFLNHFKHFELFCW